MLRIPTLPIHETLCIIVKKTPININYMNKMMPKEFIQQVLITELEDIHLNHPYISFATISIGIEFLGKCLNNHTDWNYFASGVPKQDFERAINQLNSFQDYRLYLRTHKLWDSLRNGFSHSFVPKKTISLSSGIEMEHLEDNNGKINLKCEDFFLDFKNACLEVIAMNFPQNNKMNIPLLDVPYIDPTKIDTSYTGKTS